MTRSTPRKESLVTFYRAMLRKGLTSKREGVSPPIPEVSAMLVEKVKIERLHVRIGKGDRKIIQ